MNNKPNMDIKIYSALPEEAKSIRIEVFVDEQGFTEEFDSDDFISTHIVGYIDGNAVATGRVIPAKDSFTIGRVAVKKAFRGIGLGSKIINAAEDVVKELGGNTVYIHSQLQAADFYRQLGYVTTGEYDEEEGCPHCMMIKNL